MWWVSVGKAKAYMRRKIAIIGVLVAIVVWLVIGHACSSTQADLESATVMYVVDGDTLCIQRSSVQGPEKVRLIGVDTPESVTPEAYLEKTGKQNTQEGVDASDFTKSLVKEGDTVYLQFDEDPEDKYGRLLAYVWLSKPTDVNNLNEIKTKMLNAILLCEGYAQTMEVEPNTSYAKTFSKLAR